MITQKTPPSIKKNYIYNTALTLLNILFPLITFPYVLRVLGPENYGKFGFAANLVGYLAILASFGLPVYGIKEIAKNREKGKMLSKTFSSLILIGAIGSLLSLAVFLSMMLFVTKMRDETYLFLVIGFTLILNAFSIDWFYQGLENYGFITLRSLIFKALSLILVFTVIRKSGDYVLYAGITVVALGGSNIWNILKSRSLISFKKDNLDLRPHLRPLFFLFLSAAIGSIYNMLDTVLLGFLGGNPRYVGFFTMDRKFTQFAITFVASLGTVLVPRLAFYIHSERHDDYRATAEKSLQFIYFLAFPAVALITGLSSEITYAFGGSRYTDASLSLILIAPIILITSLDAFLGFQVLIPNNDERAMLISNITGALVNVVLNLILIPELKHNACAIAITISESSVFLMQWYLGRKYIHFKLFNLQTLKYFCGAICIVLIVFFMKLLLHNPWLTLAAASFLSSLFYGTYLLLTKDLFIKSVFKIASAYLTKSALGSGGSNG